MKLALERDGEGASATAADFDLWAAPEARRSYTSPIVQLPKAVWRELDWQGLPCLQQLLQAHATTAGVIVINGLVPLDALEALGLTRHRHHALGDRTAGRPPSMFRGRPDPTRRRCARSSGKMKHGHRPSPASASTPARPKPAGAPCTANTAFRCGCS